MRLLLLEDDPILGEGLRDWLRADGHVVDWCRTLAAARAAVQGEPFDAWLLDWQLPDAEWIAEAERRSAAYDSGEMLAATWAEVKARARGKAGLDG